MISHIRGNLKQIGENMAIWYNRNEKKKLIQHQCKIMQHKWEIMQHKWQIIQYKWETIHKQIQIEITQYEWKNINNI